MPSSTQIRTVKRWTRDVSRSSAFFLNLWILRLQRLVKYLSNIHTNSEIFASLPSLNQTHVTAIKRWKYPSIRVWCSNVTPVTRRITTICHHCMNKYTHRKWHTHNSATKGWSKACVVVTHAGTWRHCRYGLFFSDGARDEWGQAVSRQLFAPSSVDMDR